MFKVRASCFLDAPGRATRAILARQGHGVYPVTSSVAAIEYGQRITLRDRTLADVDLDELIQVAERQLADAEEAYRLGPSDANRRRIMKAWSVVRRARDQARNTGGSDESSAPGGE